jgi:predicted nucleic acid-binding protein
VCEGYIRNHSEWLTTTVTLLEADAVLRKVYGVSPALFAHKIALFAAGPITVVAVDAALAISAMSTANLLGIDLADAVLLESCRAHRLSIIATDDEEFAQACIQWGLTAETPLDSTTRQQVAAWEATNLRAKGLARVLFQVRHWLDQQDP